MPSLSKRVSRRTLLRSATVVAVAQFVPRVAEAAADAMASGSAPSDSIAAARPVPPGQPGDFKFLEGEWRISHRRLKNPTDTEWDMFKGEATCWSILGGVGSIEELRIPERKFSGMGLRLLDVEKRIWSDFWVNARFGVLTTPGMPGGFEGGVGTFIADEMDGDRPIMIRGVWDNITPKSCRWHQGVSSDGGATWKENWWMEWVRA